MSKEKEKTAPIAWHPAFCSAARYVLRHEENLSFDVEHSLSSEPLRMDLLIIRNDTGKAIESDIGRLFRRYNVIEYKSPEDGLNIDDFYKVQAYAGLYKATAEHVNEILAKEITVSLFREACPRKLMEALVEEGCEIVKTAPGVYEVRNGRFFPAQIVVTKELDSGQYAGLKILSKNAREEDIEAFLLQAEKERTRQGFMNIDAILQVSVAANQGTYEKIKRKDRPMCEALRTLMKDEIEEELDKARKDGLAAGKAEGEAKGKVEGKTENQKSVAVNLFREGMDIEFISQVIKVKDDIVAQWLGVPLPQQSVD